MLEIGSLIDGKYKIIRLADDKIRHQETPQQ